MLTRKSKGRQWDHREIDWSEVVLSQRMVIAPEEEAKNRFSLEHPEGVWSCQHLSFSPVILILDFWLPNL